ncbi:MAG: hypothetical protein QF622_06770 [Candidatus Marinimicrobia bacterium]|nr:hypothetical protein [Candidatus Neomarinimicrobiota bacterium]
MALVESLKTCDFPPDIHIAIADNSSSEKSLKKLRQMEKSPGLTIDIFPYSTNYYYWPAAKKLISKLVEIHGDYPDWIMVCNNDISFPDPEFFNKLKTIDYNQFPVIGPQIRNISRQLLNPFMFKQMGWKEHLFWNLFFMSFTGSKILMSVKQFIRKIFPEAPTPIPKNPTTVYAVHGSAILFSRRFFEVGGWLDDNFSLYGEELTVAEIAKRLNCPITYYPELEIIHHEHSNTQQIKNRVLFEQARLSHKYVVSNYIKT